MNNLERTYFLKKRDLFFCISIMAGILLIFKIPVHLLFQSAVLEPFSGYFNKIIISLIIIGGCWQIAKKYAIHIFIRRITGNSKMYWMLLLPLFFPGLLLISGFSLDCHDSILIGFFFFFSFIISGVTEEIVFRGLIQGYLTKNYPLKTNNQICIITSFLFALIHFNNIQYNELSDVINQMIYAFYMGLLFSALMIRIGNTLLVGIAHGLLNTLSINCVIKEPNASNILVQRSDLTILAQVVGMVLILSPTLLIYWFLLTGIKQKKDIENA